MKFPIYCYMTEGLLSRMQTDIGECTTEVVSRK